MISRGFFREGYLDTQETLLITDRETYLQYLDTQSEYEKRKASASAEKAQQQTERSRLSAECREIIEEGEAYIRHIHECNDRIPGEEISEKLNRLELVITRIFRETEKHPEMAQDLKKMMSYYLPMTRKLLDAYCELDQQPVGGQNIDSTKKEIEDALDTLNTAFENLLDSLFQNTAWDISSDISVLNTMLAQEGLTGHKF
jgi:5-bromo-4-chloroindolyl phosphate hydrolysis protein